MSKLLAIIAMAFIAATTAFAGNNSSGSEFWLITDEMGNKEKKPFLGGEPMGDLPPKVTVLEPKEERATERPLQIVFEAYGGAKIDPDSLIVMYWNTDREHLESRILDHLKRIDKHDKFIKNYAIDIPKVHMPKGCHQIFIAIRDSEKKLGQVVHNIKVGAENCPNF
jgi:hypothetical protein